MSKSKLTTFLAVQNNYDLVELALFRQQECIDTISIEKRDATKLLIPFLSTLLEKHAYCLSDLTFISANYGPGPFTTLRVIIATVNGLSFATKIPLIGVDGLEALLTQEYDPNHPETVALLNAFNGDVYFGLQLSQWQHASRGYSPIGELLEKIARTKPNTIIRFIGNGTTLYEHEIKKVFGDYAHIPNPTPQFCTIDQIGILAYTKWLEGTPIVYQLQPQYLKSQQYKNQQGIITTI
jgi:tRNA threonylcarbamoyladenosine biosynthesis protein TsaB